MSLSLLERAARNNAALCEAVCSAHGAVTESAATYWANTRPSPRFYPNLVLTSADGQGAAAAERIRALSLPGRWGVKDSFCLLDLEALGFEPLFDATWIGLEAPRAPLVAPAWRRIANAEDLSRWERAWARGDEGGVALPAQFPASLLSRADLAFFGAEREGEFTSGALFNRSDDVVGVSNLFAGTADAAQAWASAIAATILHFPGRPLVGYESGDALQVALAQGFLPLGPLRVGLRR